MDPNFRTFFLLFSGTCVDQIKYTVTTTSLVLRRGKDSKENINNGNETVDTEVRVSAKQLTEKGEDEDAEEEML